MSAIDPRCAAMRARVQAAARDLRGAFAMSKRSRDETAADQPRHPDLVVERGGVPRRRPGAESARHRRRPDGVNCERNRRTGTGGCLLSEDDVVE
jgi:hypothetical protein